jgi:ubiquinone biosynthesis protein COQ9
MAEIETQNVTARLLRAALPHVAFDGWSDMTFCAACDDAGVAPELALLSCPRGALDLAVCFHHDGDDAMRNALTKMDDTSMKIRDKITYAVRMRLEVIDDKEVVRRAATLMALPQYAGEGASLIWGTCDQIWTALGDGSEDVNWYTKRLSLSSVYTSTVLYWLGDTSPNHEATWAFLDRRIANVMEFERFKGRVNANPVAKQLLSGPMWVLSKIKAPRQTPSVDLPGGWRSRQ